MSQEDPLVPGGTDTWGQVSWGAQLRGACPRPGEVPRLCGDDIAGLTHPGVLEGACLGGGVASQMSSARGFVSDAPGSQ